MFSSAFACSENHIYPSPKVSINTLTNAESGEIEGYFNKRFGKNNWSWENNNQIKLSTLKIPENFKTVPVTVSWTEHLKATNIEVIEAAKFNHTVASFKLSNNLSEIQFRYKRPDKQSRLYAAFKSNGKYLVSMPSELLFGGHPCAGTQYVE